MRFYRVIVRGVDHRVAAYPVIRNDELHAVRMARRARDKWSPNSVWVAMAESTSEDLAKGMLTPDYEGASIAWDSRVHR